MKNNKATTRLAEARKLDSTAQLYRYSDGEFRIVTKRWTDFYNARGVCTAHLANNTDIIGDAELDMFGKDDADYLFFAGIDNIGNK